MQNPTFSRDGPLPSSKICNALLTLVTVKFTFVMRYYPALRRPTRFLVGCFISIHLFINQQTASRPLTSCNSVIKQIPQSVNGKS